MKRRTARTAEGPVDPLETRNAAVPNTFITPQVIASRGLATLYNTIVLAGLIARDYDADFSGKQGDTVTVRKPAVFTAEEFDRTTGVTIQDAIEDSIAVVLDTIANVSFRVTDEQMTLELENFEERLLVPAMEAIAQKMDGDLAEALVDAANQNVGAESPAGNPRVASATGATPAHKAFTQARTILTRNLLPSSQRYAILSPEAVGKVLDDDLLVKVNESGSTQALREAQIGRLMGFDSYEAPVFGRGPNDRGQADGVAFHRAAVVLASRPLQLPRGTGSGQASVQAFKNISLRVVYAYNHTYKQDEVSVDTLYGINAVREQGAVELDFGQGS
jgi:hypothetical protein